MPIMASLLSISTVLIYEKYLTYKNLEALILQLFCATGGDLGQLVAY